MQDTNLVWATISSMTVWWTVGFSMMLFLSALQDISPQVLEAADIDGASKRQQLFSIVLPLLKPTTWLVVLLQVIACFKVFGQIYMITGGGPASSTRPLIQYIYETAFSKGKLGYAAAMSYVLFFILLIFSAVQQVIQKKGEKD
jgi:multiple sugar transport system permease protein